VTWPKPNIGGANCTENRVTKEHKMASDVTAANTPPPNVAQGDAKPAAKRRHKPIERFPLRFHCAITVAMGNSLHRMTGSNSLLSESDVGRLALHNYLLSNDPLYVRQMTNGNSNA
jgi:hypothetical protein